MVWQSPSAHNTSPDGQNMGGAPAGNGGPVGAEYTLQGVMRFLQVEWHKHERDRNSWEIERAEMKARIAKLEGDKHREKRMAEVYYNRIKLLEAAIKKERTARLASEAGESLSDKMVDDVDVDREKLNEKIRRIEETPVEVDNSRHRSREYLEKCLQEITYLLTPPSHPAPQQQQQQQSPDLNAMFPHYQGQMSFDHQALQQQQQHPQQQQQQHLPHPSPSPNHQPPPPPSQNNDLSQMRVQSAHSLGRNSQSAFQMDNRLQHQPSAQPQISVPSMSPRESEEKIPSSLNAYSSHRDEFPRDTNPFSAGIETAEDSIDSSIEDAWDFDEKINPTDPTPQSSDEPPRTHSVSKRRPHPAAATPPSTDTFKVKFAMRGHLDIVRAVIFTHGGTSDEPELASAGDDGVIKRWFIPTASSLSGSTDVDVTSHFTHRGHTGRVLSLASCPSNPTSQSGDGWLFSGGEDSTVKVWEPSRVEPKATLIGHTAAVWAVCVLPSSAALSDVGYERILLASGAADGTVKIWSITPPPPSSASRRSSTSDPFDPTTYASHITVDYALITSISRPDAPSPTCITPMSLTGESFAVAYNNASIIIFDAASGDEIAAMQSQETYDGTPATSINSIVATTAPEDTEEEAETLLISGHEDQYIRIYDANSGQCTYTMLAHPAAISSLALSPDGRELVSAGHDASLRFWSLEKRSCIQEITTHRLCQEEGVCAVKWSADGKWVVSGGGDGVVKVYSR